MLLQDKCRQKREELHISCGQISEKTGFPVSTVSTFFTNSRNPSLLTTGPICAVLGISLDEHFGIVNDDMPAAEVERIQAEFQKHEEELNKKIEAHAQNLLLHEINNANFQEIIRRQDLRMAEQNKTIEGLEDRVRYQKKAIFIHRAIMVALAVLSAALILLFVLMLDSDIIRAEVIKAFSMLFS